MISNFFLGIYISICSVILLLTDIEYCFVNADSLSIIATGENVPTNSLKTTYEGQSSNFRENFIEDTTNKLLPIYSINKNEVSKLQNDVLNFNNKNLNKVENYVKKSNFITEQTEDHNPSKKKYSATGKNLRESKTKGSIFGRKILVENGISKDSNNNEGSVDIRSINSFGKNKNLILEEDNVADEGFKNSGNKPKRYINSPKVIQNFLELKQTSKNFISSNETGVKSKKDDSDMIGTMINGGNGEFSVLDTLSKLEIAQVPSTSSGNSKNNNPTVTDNSQSGGDSNHREPVDKKAGEEKAAPNNNDNQNKSTENAKSHESTSTNPSSTLKNANLASSQENSEDKLNKLSARLDNYEKRGKKLNHGLKKHKKDKLYLLLKGISSHKGKVNSFCFDDGVCWPVWVGSYIIFSLCISCAFVNIFVSSVKFGKYNKVSEFMISGGSWMVSFSVAGFILGSIIGGFIGESLATALLMGGGVMLLFLSLVFLGKTGAIIGAIGGLVTGFTIGYLVEGFMAIGIGSGAGLLAGIIIGFAPWFRNLKVNESYINKKMRSKTHTTLSEIQKDLTSRQIYDSMHSSSHLSSNADSEVASSTNLAAKDQNKMKSDEITGDKIETSSQVDYKTQGSNRSLAGLRAAFKDLDKLDKPVKSVRSPEMTYSTPSNEPIPKIAHRTP